MILQHIMQPSIARARK